MSTKKNFQKLLKCFDVKRQLFVFIFLKGQIEERGEEMSSNEENLLMAMGALQNQNHNLLKENQKLNMNLQMAVMVKKRKLCGTELICDEKNSSIMVRWIFDNNTSAVEDFIFYQNEISLHNVNFVDMYETNKEVICILLQDVKKQSSYRPIVVFIEKEKAIKSTYLYRELRMAGVCFNPRIAEKKIKMVLEAYMLPRIRCINDSVDIKTKSGWMNGKYTFKENSYLSYTGLDSKLFPVLAKSFQEEFFVENDDAYDMYISEMKLLNYPEFSLLMVLLPFMGIMTSLLKSYKKDARFFINLIAEESSSVDYILSWIQIFNRDHKELIKIDTVERKVVSSICECRDQVCCLDARTYTGQASFNANNIRYNAAHIIDVLNDNSTLSDYEEIENVIVFVSREYLDGNGINIVVPPLDTNLKEHHVNFMKNKCMEKILTEFISYVEKEYSRVTDIIKKKRVVNQYLEPLFIVKEIVDQFCGYWNFPILQQGVDIIEPLFSNGDSDECDAKNVFVSIVRNAAKSLYAVHKSESLYLEDAFYYDDQYLYFRKMLLEDIFEQNHRKSFLQRAIYEFKSEGVLVTQGPKSTIKKVSIGGNRADYYIFTRDWFYQNPCETVEIIDIAKEWEEDAER